MRKARGSASRACVCTICADTRDHLLDGGITHSRVAARCGHDPAVMLRSYAKRTRKADEKAAELTGLLLKGALQWHLGPTWVQTSSRCQAFAIDSPI